MPALQVCCAPRRPEQTLRQANKAVQWVCVGPSQGPSDLKKRKQYWTQNLWYSLPALNRNELAPVKLSATPELLPAAALVHPACPKQAPSEPSTAASAAAAAADSAAEQGGATAGLRHRVQQIQGAIDHRLSNIPATHRARCVAADAAAPAMPAAEPTMTFAAPAVPALTAAPAMTGVCAVTAVTGAARGRAGGTVHYWLGNVYIGSVVASRVRGGERELLSQIGVFGRALAVAHCGSGCISAWQSPLTAAPA